jgi:signal peptidase I
LNKNNIDLQNLQNATVDFLDQGKELKIRLGGRSMYPFLRNGDIGLVKKICISNLKIGDVIVFKTSEKLIAHRLLKIIYRNKKLSLITKGDSLLKKDCPISEENYIGKIVSFDRKNKTVDIETEYFIKLNYIISKTSIVLVIIYIFVRIYWKMQSQIRVKS